MAKYLFLFGLTGEAVGKFMDKPSDRSKVVSDLAGQLGGKLESYYFMFGQYDGMVIVDLPDSTSAAAIAVAVASTGAFSSFETHELITTDQMMGILSKAKGITYTPPGG